MRRKVGKRSCALVIIIILLTWYFPYRVYAASVTAVSTPSQLEETKLNGAVIRLTVSGDEFISSVNSTNFTLVNKPTGMLIQTVSLINSTTVDITLYFKGDFDGDKTNFFIRANKEGLVSRKDDLNSNYLPIKCVVESIECVTDPSPLQEDTLNTSVISIDLNGDEFIQNLTSANFQLQNGPIGLSIGTIQRISSTRVDIYLSFTGVDFDSNKNDFKVKVLGTSLVRTTDDLTASLIIYAVKEGVPDIVAVPRPAQLYENSLDGSIIHITSRQCTFKSTLYPENFTLNNAPAGMYIKKVNFINNNTSELILGYSNADFDMDITNFSVTALQSGLSVASNLTSDYITIIAIKDLGARRNFVNTNESYPTNIQISGYNSNMRDLYINTTLYTSKTVQSGQTIVFYYYIEIFDNLDQIIGTLGRDDNLIVGSDNSTAYAVNQKVTLASPLTSKYKIVVTVNKTVIL